MSLSSIYVMCSMSEMGIKIVICVVKWISCMSFSLHEVVLSVAQEWVKVITIIWLIMMRYWMVLYVRSMYGWFVLRLFSLRFVRLLLLAHIKMVCDIMMAKIDFMRPVLFMYFMMARWERALLNLRVFHDSRPIVCNQINDSTVPHLYSRVSTAHLTSYQMFYAPINTLIIVNVFCSKFAFK